MLLTSLKSLSFWLKSILVFSICFLIIYLSLEESRPLKALAQKNDQETSSYKNIKSLEELTFKGFFEYDSLKELNEKSSLETYKYFADDKILIPKNKCKNKVKPPTNKDCYFYIYPEDLSSGSVQGSVIKSVTFDLDITGQSKVIVNRINANRQAVGQLRVLDQSNKRVEINLPLDFQNTDGISLQFWNWQSKGIRLSGIRFDYFSPSNLTKVKVKLNPDVSEIEDISSAKLYYDYNSNNNYEPEIDIFWECKEDLPGANLEIDNQGSIQIVRDESCYTGKIDPSWDSPYVALPKGAWLIVFDEGNYIVPFAIPAEEILFTG